MLKALLSAAGVHDFLDHDIEFNGVCDDTRRLKPGNLMIAFDETYIDEAYQKGATFVISQKQVTHEEMCKIISAYFSPKPQYIVAVTGTNGKTSVTHFVQQLLNLMGIKAAAIGTLGVCPNYGIEIPSLTTLPPVWLHQTLCELYQKGVRAVAIEASSHGLDQGRLDGVPFCGVALTNITHDHLDYHGSFENYRAAKKKLFTNWPQAVRVVHQREVEFVPNVNWVCGDELCDIGVRDVKPMTDGIAFELVGYGRHRIPLVGTFQLDNLLVALGLIQAMDIEIEDVLPHFRLLKSVPGRLEKVGEYNGGAIYVDYAHTPDGLETVLRAMRPHTEGRLSVVMGCGGNRDADKRPLMGAAVNEYADYVVVTDDNPRFENSEQIRESIIAACPKAINVGDRTLAIEAAITQLNQGDILVVTGKGDERYQEINGQKYPFHDRLVIEEIIKKKC